MRVKLIVDCETADFARWPDGIIPAGTSLDEPESHHLLDLGVAVPDGGLAEEYVAAKALQNATLTRLRSAERASAAAAAASAELAANKKKLAEIERQAQAAHALGLTTIEVNADGVVEKVSIEVEDDDEE